jgi:hypothetical protein
VTARAHRRPADVDACSGAFIVDSASLGAMLSL